jgi:hypothetical protein
MSCSGNKVAGSGENASRVFTPGLSVALRIRFYVAFMMVNPVVHLDNPG